MTNTLPYSDRWKAIPLITAVNEYTGQPSVRIGATQLGSTYSTAQARRVVDDWIEFFSSGPSDIRELHFVSRTPKRLFAALASQVQLERLEVKWGDYEDLTVLEGMAQLCELVLKGASSVQSLEPLRALQSITKLELESLKAASDLAPIGDLSRLTDLEFGGNWMAPRIAHVDSIHFLDQTPRIENLILHTLIVDDGDYSPLLRLPKLKQVRVMKTRRMSPSIETLKATLPWSF